MKNPLKTVKRLGTRIRRASRTSQELGHEDSPHTGYSTASESELSVTTPLQPEGTQFTQDNASGDASPDSDGTPLAEKRRPLVGGLMERGKSAIKKTATLVQDTTAAVAQPITPPALKKESTPELEVPEPEMEHDLLSPVEEALPNGEQAEQRDEAVPTVKTEVEEEQEEEPVVEVKSRDAVFAPEDHKAEKPKQQEPSAAPKQEVLYDVHAKTVVQGVLGLVALFWLVVICMVGAGRWETVLYSVLTLALTIGYCYLYSVYVKKKKRQLEALRLTPGVEGIRVLLKDLKDMPTWLSFRNREKVEWLNKCLAQMWPAYDKAVCDLIKETVEPIVQSVKPPIFKDIRFSRLRFGDVPFRVEGVEVHDITKSEIVLDIDIRWSGDANVTLAIEPNIPSVGDAARMAPKVTDISCYGTIRLMFKPLVSEMPGFGAIVATFVRTPTIRFRCDFGRALGGSVSGKMVQSALDSFIKDTLVQMYVWPQRYVIPIIYDEKITGPIEDLELRHVGVLTVKVIEARDLPAADLNGASDPTIELWTRPERKYNTSVIKKTLNPVWDDEVHHMLIQDPRSQNMSVTAYDVDLLNVSDVFKSLNIIRNLREAVYAKEFLGRALVPVRAVADSPGVEVDQWFDLGPNPLGHADGPGTGAGTFHLKMIYTPFSMLNTGDSQIGAVLITVIRCRDLIPMDTGGTSDPYVTVHLKDTTVKTHVVSACCDPEFHVNFEFYDVPVTDIIKFRVFDRDLISRDDPLGKIDIPLKRLATTITHEQQGCMRQWFKLNDVAHGDIQLKLQYIPMDKTPLHVK